MNDKPTAKDFEKLSRKLFPRRMTDEEIEQAFEWMEQHKPGGMTDEEIEQAFAEAYERVQNEPATIEAPESTDRANKVADWLSDPGLMLADLTETLNELLKHCFYQLGDYGDGLETRLDVIPSHFDEWNLLDIGIHMIFEQDAARLRIRNGIEPTPFSPDVIQAVDESFQTYARAHHSNESVSKDSMVRFTNAVMQYKTELQVLADWIEARAIFQGKKQPKSKPTKPESATEDDIATAFRQLLNDGQKPTNTAVKNHLKEVLKKTIGSDRLNVELQRLRRNQTHKKSAIVAERTAD